MSPRPQTSLESSEKSTSPRCGGISILMKPQDFGLGAPPAWFGGGASGIPGPLRVALPGMPARRVNDQDMDASPGNPVLDRLRELVVPQAPLTPAAALRVAFDLADAGTDMMRVSLQRRHPGASEEEVEAMLRNWLHCRPGAEHGDSWGRPAPERIPRP